MAVPKTRISKARKHSRRANWRLSVPGMVKCPTESALPADITKAKR